jgi:enoyl-[acyl-carrier protein] reductase I
MTDLNPGLVLAGQKALVIGVANEESIAYGCAKVFRAAGADLAITWLSEKARPYVEPLAHELGASITGAVDVAIPGQLEAGSHAPILRRRLPGV